LRAANLFEFLLESEFVKFVERQVGEQRYTPIKLRIRLEESFPLVFIAALNRCRVN